MYINTDLHSEFTLVAAFNFFFNFKKLHFIYLVLDKQSLAFTKHMFPPNKHSIIA